MYQFNEGHWSGPNALEAYSVTPGTQSLVTFTVSRADLGLGDDDDFYFDVYSSGGAGGDSAVDALSNPNVSITAWSQTYTSRTNDTGLSLYSFGSVAVADVISPAGPFAGGNAVLATNAVPAIGGGGDITNVTVGGVVASITGQGSNWVSFLAPAAGSAGAKDIVIQSASVGKTTLAGAYTVNPQGSIGGAANPAQHTLAGGRYHSLVVKENGTVVCWGGNDDGQCDVPEPNAGFVAVSAGRYFSLGIKEDGSVVGWGYNDDGQCDVPDPNMNFIAVAAGRYHSVGLKSDGTVVCWGDNGDDQCDVPEPNTNFIAVAAGAIHSAGLKSDGTVVCWGNNDDGQCDVPDPNTNFTAVAAGYYHTIGFQDDGTVVCWGDNSDDQCDVPEPNTNFIAVAAGGYHSAGLKSDGTIVCWGDNENDQCDVPEPNTNFIAVAAGGIHSAGLKSDRSIVCWGDNNDGQCDVPDPNSGFSAGGSSGVSPSSGSSTGGYPVAIVGTNLCNGADVTNVTLCGVSAAIQSQSATQVVVTAGVAASAGAGDVRVFSTSYGETVKSNAFTYLAPGMQVLGTNGAAVASGDSAQVANGTKFPQLLSGASWTNTFSITNNGTAPLTIPGFGNSNPNFEVAGLPATVAAGTASNFTVKFAPTGVGTYNSTLTISNDSPTAAYVVRLNGPCFGASTNAGPFGGGNTITIANGNFGDVTNVLVNGVAAALVESSGSIFTIVMPAATNAGMVNIVVQTSDNGDILLRDAYTYNAAGEIGWTVTEIAWTNMGSGMNDWVECLLHNGTTLYAGGLFTNAGGVSARGIAQWNGTSWSSLGNGLSGMNSRVEGLAHDGTNLYAGGSFTNSGGLAVNRVARWNGTSWSALGAGVGSAGYSDLAWDVLFADSNLYAAGRFTNSGATAVMNVAQWNGSGWAPLGEGLGRGADGDTYDVYALAHDGVNLYAGGEFTNSGAQAMRRIAMWNGTSWTNLGSGMDDYVRVLLHDGTNLYAGGAFHTAGGVTAHRIAKWDGTSWSALGSGFDYVVQALAYDGTNLYAGGAFQTAGGAPANYVAKWDGTSWSPLGSGMDNLVQTLCLNGSTLYAGGMFTTAGGVTANRVAQWLTTVTTNSGVSPASGSWTGGYEVVIGGANLGNGGDITNVTICGVAASIQSQNATQVVVQAGATTVPGRGDVRVVSTSYGETVKAGAFTYEGAGILVSGPAFGPLPVGASQTNVFTVTNSGTEVLTITAATNSGSGAAAFDVSALAGLTVQPGTASNFPVVFTASAVGAFNPACHTANNSPVPGYSFGLYGSVYQLSASSGPQAGGNTITVTNGHFGTITNVLVGPLGVVPVASGANWFTIVVPAAAGAGTVDIVVQTSDNGETTLAGSYTYNAPGQIGWTTGSTVWTNMGSGLNNYVSSILSAGENLYAGGMFTTAGGASANRVAMWNGTSWTNLGSGLDNTVYGISSDGTNLYAVGTFGWAGGVAASYIAKWNGTSWTNLGSGLLGFNAQGVLCAGSDVYAVGGFTNAGGVAANYIAKWDGTSWTNLGSGLNSSARALAHDGTNLYVGGQFTNAGGVAVMNVAKWNGTSWTNLGTGLGDRWANVYSLNFIGNSLYACGMFWDGGGKARVAMWNGSSWVGVGGGVGGDAYSMTQDGTNLYVGGNFTSPGNRVAKWNGTAWSALGSGLDSSAASLAHDGTTLYAGGSFSSAGGLAVSRIAMWTPTVATNPGVAPLSGSWTGNYEVVIQGYNLGSGTDITNVTLCGVAAAIQSQNATQVVVVAGSAAPGMGDVSVFSASQGETVKSNGFTYTAAEMYVLCSKGIVVTNGAVPWSFADTQFFPVRLGRSWTNTFSISNNGTETLSISGYGMTGSGFTVSNLPSSVAVGGVSNFAVVYAPAQAGDDLASLTLSNDSPSAAEYEMNFAGSCYVNSTNDGPFAGGNWLTISNGYFGIITNVYVFVGEEPTDNPIVPIASGSNWFTILLPAATNAGPAHIIIQTTETAYILANAYTYNPAGAIVDVAPATGSCTGGFEVVIGGTNLGNGVDITNVTICGGAVASISSQSATQVVVVAGAAPAGTGDVVVYSTSHGQTVASNAFECLRAVQAALVFAPASPQAENTTNALSVTGGTGTGTVSFAVTAGPGLIVDGTNLVATAGTGTITVVATKAGDDLYYAASVTSTVTAAYSAGIYLLDLRQIYDGTAKAASATTMPSGLTVQFTYNGSATAPTATGTYAVVGTVNDGEYLATATGTLQILAPWNYQHVTFSNGWCWVSWLGFYAPMGDGWIWHEKHGFLYLPSGQLLDDAWMFAEDMGWLWTGEGAYPFLYRQEDLSWLWYDGRTNPRWFYNFTDEAWESFNP